jgi:DNA repair exonuclease SbcCD ATPase subunit
MELNRNKTKIRLVEEKINELKDEEKNISLKKEGISGEVKGGLKGILDKILAIETELKKIRKEKLEIELNRRASEIALGIFNKIKNTSTDNFYEIEKELEKYCGKIFSDERNVSIKGLHPEKIFIRDAGGHLRTVANLSSGTKDSFVFASKLALASKLGGEKAVIVLDDPFLHLDDDRTDAAVKLLHEFHREKGWQILFFTKEKSLRERLKKSFAKGLVHDLQ